MAIFPGSAIPSAVSDDYEIDNSLRLDATVYLSKTFASAGDREQWTFSCWFKLGAATAAGGEDYLFTAGTGNSGYTDYIRFYQSKLKFACVTSGGVNGYKETTQLFRDPSAWYHPVSYTHLTLPTTPYV